MNENEENSLCEADIIDFIEAHVICQKTFSEVVKSLEAKKFFALEQSINADRQLEASAKKTLLKSGKNQG